MGPLKIKLKLKPPPREAPSVPEHAQEAPTPAPAPAPEPSILAPPMPNEKYAATAAGGKTKKEPKKLKLKSPRAPPSAGRAPEAAAPAPAPEPSATALPVSDEKYAPPQSDETNMEPNEQRVEKAAGQVEDEETDDELLINEEPAARSEPIGPSPSAALDTAETTPLEPVQAAGITLDMPVSLFEIEKLSDILSLETWDTVLSEQERQKLCEHLPQDAGLDRPEAVRELLKSLLGGEDVFHFNNPLAQLWADMQEGLLHPRLVKYRDGLSYLQEIKHFHTLRTYHNKMVNSLLVAKEVLSEERGNDNTGEDLPLADRIKKWREAEPGETLEPNDPQSSGRKREYPQEQEDSGVTKPCKNKWRRLNTLSTSTKLLGTLHSILTAPSNAQNGTTIEKIARIVDKDYPDIFVGVKHAVLYEGITCALEFLSNPSPEESSGLRSVVSWNDEVMLWSWTGGQLDREGDMWKSVEKAFVPIWAQFVATAKANATMGTLADQKGLATISESSKDVRELFQIEEAERYSKPTEAYSYTTPQGTQSVVAPLRNKASYARGAVTKAREHFLLIPSRPPEVSILSVVRDSAARLPGFSGTRGDVAMLVRDSQYLVSQVNDAHLTQVVSGALDRLHYEADPCVKFDADRKLWCYLHGERSERDFKDYNAFANRRGARRTMGERAVLPDGHSGGSEEPLQDEHACRSASS